MRHLRGLWILVGVAALAGAAVVGVRASSAAPARATSTIDVTYSCPVQKQHFISLYGGATLPPQNNRPRPGGVFVTTGVRTVTKNGVTSTVAQLSFQAVKNSLRIDKKSCRRVTKQIPLKPKGLPGPAETATATLRGYINQRCDSTARVLLRLQLQLTNGTPTRALVAVRNDDVKSKPIAFFNWIPRKVALYSAAGCVDQN